MGFLGFLSFIFISAASLDCKNAVVQIPGASFKVEKVAPKIILLKFDSQREMTRSLLRVQEHYESPHFAGKFFTLKEFKKWYPKSRGLKKFTYYTDWGGFNFPGTVLEPFYLGNFKYLQEREHHILASLYNMRHPFYVIAVSDINGASALDHELAHAFFYLYPNYRAKVLKLLKQYRLAALSEYILSMGYREEVVLDEIQAYLANDFEWLINSEPQFKNLQELSEKLSKLFKQQKKRAVRQP